MSAARRKTPPTPLVRARQSVWRWCWRAIAFVLIGTAVLLTLARLLLPFAAEYQAELVQRVESYLGYEVSVGQLDIDWQGLGPRIRMSDLRIYEVGPRRETITFDEAFIRLHPVLRDGAPAVRLDDFSLRGFTLAARLDEQGRLHAFGAEIDPAALGGLAALGGSTAGVDPEAAPAGDAAGAGAPAAVDAGLDRLFSISRLALTEATLVVTRPDGSELRWSDLTLTLANSGDDHRLAVSVTPPAALAEHLAARLEFRGRPAAYRKWRASLFLDARRLSLSRLNQLWPGAPVTAEDGRLDARLWSDWDGGRLLEARADLRLEEFELAAQGHPARARFERLGGHLRLWQPTAAQWQADVGQLEVSRAGEDWQGERLSYAREDDGDWRVAADYLRVEDLAALAAVLPFEEATRQRLAAARPRGEVHGLNLAVAGGGDFRLRGDFRDLGWSADGQIPGLTGLDGRAVVTRDEGRIALESSDVGFDAPTLFRQPLWMQELSATVHVVPAGEGYRLQAPRVHVRNRDLRGRGRVEVDVAPGESPRLDLQFEYGEGIASAVPRYLPAGIMPGPMVGWLDQAFRAGRVPGGSFILRGRADDFPYREHDGVFDVRFDVADTELHYGEGWPVIEDLAGQVRFSGPSLDISADRGRTRAVRLERGRARIADLREGLLEVQLQAAGPLQDMLDVVRDSPLQPRFAPVLDAARGSGAAALELALSVPVKEVSATRVDGTLRLAGAGLAQPRYGLAFEQLQGAIGFSEQAVRIDGLRAELRGRPLRLDAETRDGIAHFRARGQFAPDELLPALAGSRLAGGGGRADWDIALDVPLGGDGAARLAARSDLRGIRIDLPRPLGKPAAEVRDLRLEMPLDSLRVRASYGARTRLLLELGDDDGLSLRRGALAFGEAPRLPEAEGLQVAGSLPRLALAPWVAHAGGGSGDGLGLPLVGLDLRVDRLGFSDYALSRARLIGQQVGDGGWSLAVVSNEATGRLTWPVSTQGGPPVDVRFEWVDLALMRRPEAAATEGEAPETFQDPANLPPLDVRIERLKLTDATLQDVTLLTGTRGGVAMLHQIGFRTAHLHVNGQGQWRSGSPEGFDLRLVVRSDDFGAGLRELGLGGMVADGNGKVTFDLGWPGLPWAPSLASLSGHVNVEIEDGVLTEVKPGAARLLGIFSLKAVPFRSLLQSGLIFREMKGRVDLRDGNAYTKLLKIDSTVGLIKITGRTGLVARDYDQRVVVLPELSSSLPVLGFLSGGPITGVAIALLQGLARNVGGDVEKAGQIEYTVTGSWDDPKIERVGGPEPEYNGETGVTESPR